jgi:hypothetical protein
MPPELIGRLSLRPDLEVIVARERGRQRLLRTPTGTPRHTLKKTAVVDTLSVQPSPAFPGSVLFSMQVSDAIISLEEPPGRRRYPCRSE